MPNPTESGPIATPRPYPPSIARAADRATDDRLASVRALSVKARLALQKIIRCISTSDITKSVRIGRNLLADILGVSTKTISRIKAELENTGWIERNQVKSRMYGMQVGDIWLTPWALQELQLVVPGKLDPVNMPIANEDSIAIRAAAPQQADFLSKNVPRSVGQKCPTPYSLSQSLSERQSAAAALSEVSQEKSPPDTTTCASAHDSLDNPPPQAPASDSSASNAPVSANDDSVPDDLILLQICGISVAGIRKLMGMATRAGHFLGNIVEVASDSILGARKPFSYVRKLISSKTDWMGKLAYLREQEVEQQHLVKQEQLGKEVLDTIRQAMAKTGMIASYKRTHVWKLDGEGTVRKAEITQLLADSTLVNWQPLLDIAGLAQAIGEGKLFAVDMQDLRDMQSDQGDKQHHEGEGSQQDEQAMPQAVYEPLQELPVPTPVAVPVQADPAAPVAQPTPSAAPPKKAQVKPAKQQRPQQPWHHLPQRRELDAIWAAAAQSPDALLSNHKQAKVWKIVDGWLRVTTVQELLNMKTAIINWKPLGAEAVVDFAKRLKQGQLFPVDKQTVQSWCS